MTRGSVGLIAAILLVVVPTYANAQSILPPIVNGDFDMSPPLFAWQTDFTERGGGSHSSHASAAVEDAQSIGGDSHALRLRAAVSIPGSPDSPTPPVDTGDSVDADPGSGDVSDSSDASASLPFDAAATGHARAVVSQTFMHTGGQTVVAAIAWRFCSETGGDGLADLWLRMQVDNLLGGHTYTEIPLNIPGSGNPSGAARSLYGVAGWREYRIDLSSIELALCGQFQVSFELVAIAHVTSPGSFANVIVDGWIDHVRLETVMDETAAPVIDAGLLSPLSYAALTAAKRESSTLKYSAPLDALIPGFADYSDASTGADSPVTGDCGTPSFSTIASGDDTGFGVSLTLPPERCVVVSIIRDRSQWAEFWAEHSGSPEPAPRPPYVDFNSHAVAAIVSGERPTGCYGIALNKVVPLERETRLEIVETTPGEWQGCSDAPTRPYHLALLPNACLDFGQQIAIDYRTQTAAIPND